MSLEDAIRYWSSYKRSELTRVQMNCLNASELDFVAGVYAKTGKPILVTFEFAMVRLKMLVKTFYTPSRVFGRAHVLATCRAGWQKFDCWPTTMSLVDGHLNIEYHCTEGQGISEWDGSYFTISFDAVTVDGAVKSLPSIYSSEVFKEWNNDVRGKYGVVDIDCKGNIVRKTGRAMRKALPLPPASCHCSLTRFRGDGKGGKKRGKSENAYLTVNNRWSGRGYIISFGSFVHEEVDADGCITQFAGDLATAMANHHYDCAIIPRLNAYAPVQGLPCNVFSVAYNAGIKEHASGFIVRNNPWGYIAMLRFLAHGCKGFHPSKSGCRFDNCGIYDALHPLSNDDFALVNNLDILGTFDLMKDSAADFVLG